MSDTSPFRLADEDLERLRRIEARARQADPGPRRIHADRITGARGPIVQAEIHGRGMIAPAGPRPSASLRVSPAERAFLETSREDMLWLAELVRRLGAA